MRFLIDTNVISELRKKSKANRNVSRWYASLDPDSVLLSVLTIGEIRSGIEKVRRRDSTASLGLDRWLGQLLLDYGERILPVHQAIAEEWGRMTAQKDVPVVDGLLAATAKVNGLILATRNVKDIADTGVPAVNPFDPFGSG